MVSRLMSYSSHVEMMSKNPDIDVGKVLGGKYLWEWDRDVQCHVWGYPTEDAYYRDASSADAALNIKIPTLALHASDDPVCDELAVPQQECRVNPHIVLCTTSIGGHLGWFQSNGERWSNRTVCYTPMHPLSFQLTR